MLEKPIIAGNSDHAISLFKWGVGTGVVLAFVGIAVIASVVNDDNK